MAVTVRLVTQVPRIMEGEDVEVEMVDREALLVQAGMVAEVETR